MRIGTTQIVIGAAELLGSMSILLFSDKLGLRNTLLITSAMFSIAIFCLIPVSSSSELTGVLVVLFLIYMPGEAAIVANLAVTTTYVPLPLKTTLLGINLQSMAISRAVATKVGEYLYREYSLVVVRTPRLVHEKLFSYPSYHVCLGLRIFWCHRNYWYCSVSASRKVQNEDPQAIGISHK